MASSFIAFSDMIRVSHKFDVAVKTAMFIKLYYRYVYSIVNGYVINFHDTHITRA